MKIFMQFTRISLTVFLTVINLSFNGTAQQTPRQRLFQPEDLFRVWQIGATRWSPDGRFSVIEVLRPGRTLDRSLPTGEIRILDAGTRTLRTISSPSPVYIGFFNPIWSPDGRHLAFLSVDANAVVQPWIWTVGAKTPRPLAGLDVSIGALDVPIIWVGSDHLALVAWESAAEKSGPLYFRITRGRKIADGYKRAAEMNAPTVSVVESNGAVKPDAPQARLMTIDIRSGEQRTLVSRGGIHRLSASADGRYIAFHRQNPGIPNQPVASYFALKDADEAYDAVNWGTKRQVIDARTGSDVDPSLMPARPTAAKIPKDAIPLPKPGARLLSAAAGGNAALFLTNDSEGSSLWLAGGDGRAVTESSAIWRANEWVKEIKTGATEPISYQSTDGKTLTAWLLLPPNYTPGTKIPIITIVYPGQTYEPTLPGSLSLLQPNFEHPQLFAALGYGVLLPSMPEDETRSLQRLQNGVLPAIDAVVSRGIADSDRIAVLGQSDGGFAVLGLLTQTTRFRSAMASAAFSNLASLYGTFYGQYRYGDAGLPQTGIVLRLLQLEKGYGGMGGPPWTYPDRYRESSAVLQADKVVTPLMLIHGDLDFVPIQQSEEFFSALYRQDKRAVLVRYQGEWHTIASRPNVLDLWRRIGVWLTETMAPR
jgi:dipeptidyl aminopeptidase/acylaminoacyl peptidase